jgi:hypothetical protein
MAKTNLNKQQNRQAGAPMKTQKEIKKQKMRVNLTYILQGVHIKHGLMEQSAGTWNRYIFISAHLNTYCW